MACPDDETLLALIDGRLRDGALASTDEHLDSCDACREVVATLASGRREKAFGAARAETLGRFVVLDRLGEGAMGAVFAAYDPELDRKVALKRLHPGTGGATRRARLTREAQAMARLTHPNVVTVHEVGVEGDEIFVAMELVRGESLRAWLAQRRPQTAVLDVLVQAGRGLAAAHAAGIVHRDFKPENVLVGADGRVLVGDFGLAGEETDGALRVETSSMLTASLTETGAMLGTPAYMAPEQLTGARASALSDQFAFAVTAWEALEGRRPFAEARTIEGLREAIARGPERAATLARGLERALRRGLAPEPAQRWPSMGALLDALRPTDTRARWLVLGTVATLVAGSVAVPLLRTDPCEASRHAMDASWSQTVRETILPVATPTLGAWAARWSEARVDACEATHQRHEQSEGRLDARMACLDRQRGRFDAIAHALGEPTSLASVPELLSALPDPQACASSDLSAPADPASQRALAQLERRLDEATVLLATGRPEDALALAEAASTEEIVSHHASLDGEIQLLRADALRALARYEGSLEAARSSLFRAEDAPDPRGVAIAWLALVRTHGAAGRFAEAGSLLPHAEAALARAGTPRDLHEMLLRTRANVRIGLGALSDAHVDLDEALVSMRARLGEASLELAPVHTSLGNLARLEERLDDALREHETALSLDRAALGDGHPRVARDLHNVAGVLRRLERRDEARARYEEALSIATRALGDDHPEAALTRNSLGLLAFEAGDRVLARAHWERALADLSTHGHGDAALASYNLALLELAEEHADVAVARARQAIAMDERSVGLDAKRVAGEHLVLGRALADMGRVGEAREALNRALELTRRLDEHDMEVDIARELAALDAAPISPPASVPAIAGPRAASAIPTTRPAATEPVAAPEPVPATEPEPAPVVAPAPAAPPPVTHPHPAGSGAYGAGVPWE